MEIRCKDERWIEFLHDYVRMSCIVVTSVDLPGSDTSGSDVAVRNIFRCASEENLSNFAVMLLY
jgi:hypothetical protein